VGTIIVLILEDEKHGGESRVKGNLRAIPKEVN
jgi:hypothetical protein